eukprot:scaffold68008_cov21-Tisochrysis_lutea.AAC.8
MVAIVRMPECTPSAAFAHLVAQQDGGAQQDKHGYAAWFCECFVGLRTAEDFLKWNLMEWSAKSAKHLSAPATMACTWLKSVCDWTDHDTIFVRLEAETRRELTMGRLPPVQPFHAMAYPFRYGIGDMISGDGLGLPLACT